MQDHPNIPSTPPPHGLRPETWAVAEYDALREALSVLMADIISERRRHAASRSVAREQGNSAEEERLSRVVQSFIQLEQVGHRARAEHETDALRAKLINLQQQLGELARFDDGVPAGMITSRVA